MSQRPPPSHFLNSRDTFEQYENRSRPGSVAGNYHQGQGYPSHHASQLACEYRANPGHLACEYRAQPQSHVTAYIPESNKKQLPVGVVIAIAIIVPVLIIVSLFGAVWLQELGVL